jgi:hypothetical protein
MTSYLLHARVRRSPQAEETLTRVDDRLRSTSAAAGPCLRYTQRSSRLAEG